MRIPYLAGRFDRTRRGARLVVAEGRTPRPIPGPWRMVAVVRPAPAAAEASPERPPRKGDVAALEGPARPL